MMVNLWVLEDRGKEVKLSTPTAWRVGVKLVAIGFGVFSILLTVNGYPAYLFFFGGLALWFWKVVDDRTIIRFNQPPGYITVDYYRWSLLGAWPFLKNQKRLPLSEASRRRSEVIDGWMQTSPTSAVPTTNYRVWLPDGSGNSFKLWEGTDPEVQFLLDKKIQGAILENEAEPG